MMTFFMDFLHLSATLWCLLVTNAERSNGTKPSKTKPVLGLYINYWGSFLTLRMWPWSFWKVRFVAPFIFLFFLSFCLRYVYILLLTHIVTYINWSYFAVRNKNVMNHLTITGLQKSIFFLSFEDFLHFFR